MNGISLKALRAKTRNVEIDIDGDTLNLTYAPSRYTPNVEKQFKESMSDGAPLASLAALLSKLLVGWNLTDEDDKGREVAVPVNADTLAELGLDVLNLSVEAVIKDMQPKER